MPHATAAAHAAKQAYAPVRDRAAVPPSRRDRPTTPSVKTPTRPTVDTRVTAKTVNRAGQSMLMGGPSRGASGGRAGGRGRGRRGDGGDRGGDRALGLDVPAGVGVVD